MIFSTVSITGTNNDFGNKIKSSFINKEIKEFNNISDVDTLIEETKDIEVFVNYEYNKDLQLEITKKWFKVHQNKKHLLINILWAESFIKLDNEYVQYFQEKKKLNEFSWEVNLAKKSCLCILISPGLSDNLADSLERSKRFKENSIDISKEIIDLIHWTIKKFYEV